MDRRTFLLLLPCAVVACSGVTPTAPGVELSEFVYSVDAATASKRGGGKMNPGCVKKFLRQLEA